jgi:hypothetical protein
VRSTPPPLPWLIRVSHALRDKIRPAAHSRWLTLGQSATALAIARRTVLRKVHRGAAAAVPINQGQRQGPALRPRLVLERPEERLPGNHGLVPARTHVSAAMCEELQTALQVGWENAQRARAALRLIFTRGPAQRSPGATTAPGVTCSTPMVRAKLGTGRGSSKTTPFTRPKLPLIESAISSRRTGRLSGLSSKQAASERLRWTLWPGPSETPLRGDYRVQPGRRLTNRVARAHRLKTSMTNR